MAGALAQSGSRGGRRGRRQSRRPLSEINVTPFVDVMLVLLIVFMVTAPLLTAGIKVELPRTEARALPADRQPISVTIRREGEIFIQDEPISLEDLVERLTAIAQDGGEQRILVRGEADAPYGRIAEVMAVISNAGFRNIGLVTDPVDGGRRER